MIPVNSPLLAGNEAAYLNECLQSGWISSAGKYLERFEVELADYLGVKHAVAVSSGSAALEVALGCLGLNQGDEIIMPTFTIICCATAIIYNGGTPVLVDAEADTWCMNTAEVAKRITPRTRGIMAVHIYGHPVDMDPLYELAGQHDLTIIEDAAEGLGARYKGRPCGSLGDLSCLSFYANKVITTGEGGAVLTNNDALADKARSLRNLCFEPDRRFYHRSLGHNFRMTNMQAALGVAQLERIEAHIDKKLHIAEQYNEQLADLTEWLSLPVERPWAKNIYWMYGLVLKESLAVTAEEFSRELEKLGVQSRSFFLGMHEQPAMHQRGLFVGECYPVAERLARRGLYLPSGLAITDEQIAQVCKAVKNVLQEVTY